MLRVGINGRRPSQFTDPNVDIAAEEWSHFKHHEWILPSPGYDRPDPPAKVNQRQRLLFLLAEIVILFLTLEFSHVTDCSHTRA